MLFSQALLALLVIQAGLPSVVCSPFPLCILHGDAVDRTRCYTQVAACAQIGNDRVHQFVGTGYGIHWTGLYAQGAADAVGFVNDRNLKWHMEAACCIQRQFGYIQKSCQLLYAVLPARRAAVDWGFVQCNGACIRQAAVIAAFCTLRLRQNAVD